ncbi:50S ribosomal protein L24 [Kallotenue papyrolyticum]|uniref:50S ribosomal protein L24 n=1 Tax=Kallotenue papyrolyticum TaxID=1325125 RepID=UPI00047854FE|nr:50S ribosomal protein L24 [Kallotenue papyrolyticum]
MHVKAGDEVLVIAGKNKGARGKVRRALPSENRVIVENVNLVKKHMKPRGPRQRGGIIEVEAPLHASNVMLICPHCGKASRTGHRFLEGEGKLSRRKVRYCKACDATIDQPKA